MRPKLQNHVSCNSILRTVLIVLFLAVVQADYLCCAETYLNEPDGFGDLKWGDSPRSKFSENDFLGNSIDEKSALYQQLNDRNDYELDKIKLFSIVYSFYRETFWKVSLEARLLNAGKLFDLLCKKHGAPDSAAQLSEFSREYIWHGLKTDILFQASLNYYDSQTIDMATVSLQNTRIRADIDTNNENTGPEKQQPIDSLNGFRGEKWGSSFNPRHTYLPLENEPYYVYLKKADNMLFEGITVEEIRYRFHNNRALHKVELYFNGKQNYLMLKKGCFRLFGTSTRYEGGEIRWIGKKSSAKLSLRVEPDGNWKSRLELFGFGAQ